MSTKNRLFQQPASMRFARLRRKIAASSPFSNRAPNPRMQRTGLRLPLSRKPFGVIQENLKRQEPGT